MDITKLRKVEEFGKKYCEKYLSKYDPEKLANDWYYALVFFFDHSFMRGRKDVVSGNFERKALEVLEKTLKEDLGYHLETLKQKLQQNGVNNRHDRNMIADTIDFIKGIPNNNIVSYSADRVRDKKEYDLFQELKKIRSVKNKIASFYIRDLVSIFGLPVSDYRAAYPVDTWVRQLSIKLGVIDEKEQNLDRIRDKSIEMLLRNNIDPVLFNQGAWFVSYHAYDILIENLDKV